MNDFVIMERNKEIKELEKEVEFVVEVQAKLSEMVKDQGEEIDKSERNIRFTYDSCLQAAESLMEVEKQTNSNHKKKFWLGMGLVAGFCVATLAVVGIKSNKVSE